MSKYSAHKSSKVVGTIVGQLSEHHKKQVSTYKKIMNI